MIEWKKEGRVWTSREDGESLMWVVEVRKEYNTPDKEYFVVRSI